MEPGPGAIGERPVRIALVGNICTGKTTAARRLGQGLGLPNHHLDLLFWRVGWEHATLEEFAQSHREIIATPHWVIDGNYPTTMAERFAAADLILLLDYPRAVSYWRALKRNVVHFGRERQDLPPGCLEADMLGHVVRHIWSFPNGTRKEILRHLKAVDNGRRQIFHLHRPAALNETIREIVGSSTSNYRRSKHDQ
jgi:adenylate kinase family enzyme